jgi:hypothetical protein
MRKEHRGHASGGNIYERQMMGEKKGAHSAHANYESEMRGEHIVHKPKNEMSHYAKGGVGKIRHEQATMSGAPKAPKGLGKIARG